MKSGEWRAERKKPPVGTAPYYIIAGGRITELAEAIERYAGSGCEKEIECIEQWAAEIVEQCRVIRTMRNRENRER